MTAIHSNLNQSKDEQSRLFCAICNILYDVSTKLWVNLMQQTACNIFSRMKLCLVSQDRINNGKLTSAPSKPVGRDTQPV